MASPENKSFLAAGINSWSPWGSRSATPKPQQAQNDEKETSESAPSTQKGGDHRVSTLQRISTRSYPQDCPPLAVRWFHAVDAPKRKPMLATGLPKPGDKPLVPKKYIPFSLSDSKAIESNFQKLSESAEDEERKRLQKKIMPDVTTESSSSNPHQDRREDDHVAKSARVAVNEDFLFEVDIDERELAPAYWLGPVYEVRRGSWFFTDGSSQRPCDENLANQLEEGYIKTRPWLGEKVNAQRSSTKEQAEIVKSLNEDSAEKPEKIPDDSGVHEKPVDIVIGKNGAENLERATIKVENLTTSPNQTRTYRLFGAHMNSMVTYQDATTAWLLTDDLLSRMSSTVYQRFAGGGHLAGIKLIRGYLDTTEKANPEGTRSQRRNSRSSDDGASDKEIKEDNPVQDDKQHVTLSSEKQRRKLERHMSSLVESGQSEDPTKQEEELRRREEKEIRDDYKDDDGSQGRDIEHLLLITHGIGQRLGLRLETINFVHDVNTLRKSLKSVYAASPDLQVLNEEVDRLPKNCRIQVLPICWRHLLDFPKQSLKHNRAEHDLGDSEYEDQEYPNLDDITVEGVPAIRNLMTDLALDILLYQSPTYKEHISRIVLRECNRIYALFKEKNPGFKGRVSLVGHSLGSAIMFDILCKQKDHKIVALQSKTQRIKNESLALDFEVEDFYALGSPIGLFQMLKGRTIVSRQLVNSEPPETPISPSEDPFVVDNSPVAKSSALSTFDITMSSPKCQQIFNIFHPTDPVSYRLEPLISPAMSALKPQPLPYTKKGIFGAPVGQGLTGIGARVGQSVSGLWTNFSSGIASSLLNRSLGIPPEGSTNRSTSASPSHKRSSSIGTSEIGLNGSPTPKSGDNVGENSTLPKRQLTQDMIGPGEVGEHPPTLIDSEIETLYSGFQKSRHTKKDSQDLARDAEWQELEERSKKLRREEVKVRALNSNGRVDYAIQEGAFDISMLASIASHMSYWADEDVSHFMISQLLARHRVIKK